MANVLWELSTLIDAHLGVISFDSEPANRLTLREYVQNYPRNYISAELLQGVGLQLVRGLRSLQIKRILCEDLKTSNIFVFHCAQESLVKIGDLCSSLRLDAFGVDSAS